MSLAPGHEPDAEHVRTSHVSDETKAHFTQLVAEQPA
jgi:hypothetical protein